MSERVRVEKSEAGRELKEQKIRADLEMRLPTSQMDAH